MFTKKGDISDSVRIFLPGLVPDNDLRIDAGGNADHRHRSKILSGLYYGVQDHRQSRLEVGG